MLPLSGRIISIKNVSDNRAGLVLRLVSDDESPTRYGAATAYLVASNSPPAGYPAYVIQSKYQEHASSVAALGPTIFLGPEFDYLEVGDIFAASTEDRRIRVLHRKASPHNSFLVTERCDNYCLMCSQPPRDVGDDWIIDEILETLAIIDSDTKEIGFTGGEPTLLGDRLLDVLRSCKTLLPNTAIHVLSNGRSFKNFEFARAWADIDHPDLMVGIPVYSDVSHVHDYVVQADGAFDETIRGILNLKQLKQRVEIRVVIHKQTYKDLPRLAEFISRNLTFVDHVALMGLEIMGFTRANLDLLWIDPLEYQDHLSDAVQTLAGSGLNVSIYNHQLCLLKPAMWQYARRSISDWKNEYFEPCMGCEVRERCGGFFSSAKYRRSENIRPIKMLPDEAQLSFARHS